MLGAHQLLTGDRHEMQFLGDADTFNDHDLQRRIVNEKPMRRIESRCRGLNRATSEETQLKLIGQKHSGARNEAFAVGLDNFAADVLAAGKIAYDRITGIEDTLREVASQQVSLRCRRQIATQYGRHLEVWGLPGVLEERFQDRERRYVTKPSRMPLVVGVPGRVQRQWRPAQALQHWYGSVVANHAV